MGGRGSPTNHTSASRSRWAYPPMRLCAGVAAAHVQDDGFLRRPAAAAPDRPPGWARRRYCRREMDGDARACSSSACRVPGAHEGLCLIQIEEVDGAALCRPAPAPAAPRSPTCRSPPPRKRPAVRPAGSPVRIFSATPLMPARQGASRQSFRLLLAPPARGRRRRPAPPARTRPP